MIRTATRSRRAELTIEEGSTESLQTLGIGARGTFTRVSDSEPDMLRWLADRGIAPGDGFEVIDKQPFDGPLFVRFGEDVHVLGGALARAMRVEVTALTPPPTGIGAPILEGATADGQTALSDGAVLTPARPVACSADGSAPRSPCSVRRSWPRSRTSIRATSRRTSRAAPNSATAAVGRGCWPT